MDDARLQPMERLPEWLPGRVLFDRRPDECPGLLLRGFKYNCQDVRVPPMEGYTIALFHSGYGQVSHKAQRQWRNTNITPGNITLMTRGEETRWRWDSAIRVTHLYLDHSVLDEVAKTTFSGAINRIHLANVLHTDDSVLRRIVQMLYNEICADMLGVDLLLEALQTQLCVHLLRQYATVQIEEARERGRLTRTQRQKVISFVKENIHRKVTLAELSHILNMSVSQTIRLFRAEFGVTPHMYVLQQRFAHAKSLIKKTPDAPLKMVAIDSGFSDQSHMTRVFQRLAHQSPGSYRASCGRKVSRVQVSDWPSVSHRH